jgi:hypothetical protein
VVRLPTRPVMELKRSVQPGDFEIMVGRSSADYLTTTLSVRQAIFALLDDQWMRVARSGVDVILDYGFPTRASRDTARRQADAVGAACHSRTSQGTAGVAPPR